MKKPQYDGTRTSYHVEDGKEYIGHTEDMTPHIEVAHELGRDKVRSERMGDMPHLARIPNLVAYKIMAQTGLNFFDKDDWKEIWKIIKRDYPVFIVTPHNV